MPLHRLTPRILPDEQALRAIIGTPNEVVASKVADRLTPLTRTFVERSPYVVLATADASGGCDCSPRGDPPGFVRILDDRTLLLPERPGNRIADSLRNILQNPHVGLLFVLPGVGDTFRVDGRAALTDDPDLLAPSTVEGKAPKLGILVDIEHAYLQCSKASLRASLWDPLAFQDRADFPSSGEILASIRGDVDPATYDAERAQRYARREGFY